MQQLADLEALSIHSARVGLPGACIEGPAESTGIFDIGMPDLSGYDVAERIRHETRGKDMTLIAITGWGQDSDKRRALRAGFDHHLTKPCDPEQLAQLLQRSQTPERD